MTQTLNYKQIAHANTHELNELISSEIFNEEPFFLDQIGLVRRNSSGSIHPLFNYTTDIGMAWSAIKEVMRKNSHWSPTVAWDDDDGDGNPQWVVSFYYYGEDESQFRMIEVWDKSETIAICKAVLFTLLPDKDIFYPSVGEA